MNYFTKQNLKYAVIIGILMVISYGLVKRSQNAPNQTITVPDQIQVAPSNSILSEEEQAQVRVAQELVLKEAEHLKKKEQLVAERDALNDEIQSVEMELGKIRVNKMSFLEFRPKQDASQRQSTKPNAVVTVSVITQADLERLDTFR
jgi:hypothetical protein